MHDILNLERYPLDKPGSDEWAALVSRSRQELETNGLFNLDGFLLPSAIRAVLDDVECRFEADGFEHARRHNVYFDPDPPMVPPGHPVRMEFETSNRTLCGDQLSADVLIRLYEYPEFRAFLAAVLDRDQLNLMADPLARINVMQYVAGQALNWHFDRSEFTTTLLLQAPKVGGLFEYRRNLRTDDDPNHDGVARVLTGQDPDVRSISLTAGTLNVFTGKNTVHRVTKVVGDTARIIAVFSYYDRPDVTMSDEERRGFYGRAEPLDQAQ